MAFGLVILVFLGRGLFTYRSLGQVRDAAQQGASGDQLAVDLQRLRTLLVYGNVLGALLIGTAGWIFLRSLRARRRIEDERDRFFALSVDLLCIVGPDGQFRRANDAFTETLGWTAEEMQGRSVLDFIHPDDHAATRAELARLAAGEPSYGLENRCRRKDGSWRRISWRARPYPAEDELYAIGRDITDERTAHEVLRASEERYRTLFTSMDQGFCVLELIRDSGGRTVDYRFLEVNPAFEKHTGVSDAVGKLMTEIAPIESYWPEMLGRVAETGEAVRFEQRAEGLQRDFDVFAFPIGFGPDRRVGALFSDVTERRRGDLAIRELNTALRQRAAELAEAREGAEAASRAKSAFLATMSHEIRTPMIGVLGMVEVLERSALSDEQRAQLNVVHQSAQSLMEILGNILDFSKIEAGKLELNLAPVPLRRVVARVVDSFRAAVEARGLTLDLHDDPAAADTHVTDSVRLAQILGNWVSNAIKFTERGGITVRLRVVAEMARSQVLEISVADTGIGIPEPQLSRLFQPFTQADESTTRRFGGTGLGLAITRRLAELLGGTVDIASAPGKGTVLNLRITLPVGSGAAEPDPERPAAEAGPSPRVPGPQRGRVLLAEDHPVNQKVLTLQLKAAGCDVDLAEDGLQALDRFHAGRYALVFTDLHMPGLDGHALIEAIRAHERAADLQRTPIVVLTADVRREEMERCLAEGADDFLAKPVTIEQLAVKLDRWLRPG